MKSGKARETHIPIRFAIGINSTYGFQFVDS